MRSLPYINEIYGWSYRTTFGTLLELFAVTDYKIPFRVDHSKKSTWSLISRH